MWGERCAITSTFVFILELVHTKAEALSRQYHHEIHRVKQTAADVYRFADETVAHSRIVEQQRVSMYKAARRAITLAANTHLAAQTGDEAEMKRRRLETVACLRNLRDVSAHHASLVYGIGGTMPLHADVYGT